jgi:hypothetical protein
VAKTAKRQEVIFADAVPPKPEPGQDPADAPTIPEEPEEPEEEGDEEGDEDDENVSAFTDTLPASVPLAGQHPPAPPPGDALAGKPLDGELSAPRPVYRQRIRVLEAFQYRGQLRDAPAWVDRNWAAWAEMDPLRNIDAGPAVRVPLPGGMNAMARVGDYIVQQEVQVTDRLTDVRVEVWPQEQFEKFFIPERSEDRSFIPENGRSAENPRIGRE